MGRVLTNNTQILAAREATQGTLTGTPLWIKLEPDDLTNFTAEITKVARDPISRDRQRRKGTPVSLDSGMEFAGDLTGHHFHTLAESFAFVNARYPYSGGTNRRGPIYSGSDYLNLAADADAGGDSYTHDSITTAMVAGRLVFARGFVNPENNGMKEVDAGSTATVTEITGANALVDETPNNARAASIEIAGQRYLTANGVTWTNATKTLTRTGGEAFDTLGLTVGQWLHIGGLTTANQYSGGTLYGRIKSITATTIVLERTRGSLSADQVAEDVDLLFGSFIRNVSTDDAEFAEIYWQFELSLPNLDNPSGDKFQYSIGNLGNQMTVNLPLEDKATVTFAFVGLDTEKPVVVGSRKGNTAEAQRAVQTEALNTASSYGFLRPASNAADDDLAACIKTLTLTLNNQVTPEKCQGQLAASFTNFGNMLMDVELEALLTDSRLQDAVRDNDTLSFDFVLENGDGAIGIDIPSATLAGGTLAFPRNESVTISGTMEAFVDDALGYTVGMSTFPAVPLDD